MADWLGMGLQSPVTGFDSRRRLHLNSRRRIEMAAIRDIVLLGCVI